MTDSGSDNLRADDPILPTLDPLHTPRASDSPHNAFNAGCRFGWNDRENGISHRKHEVNPYPEESEAVFERRVAEATAPLEAKIAELEARGLRWVQRAQDAEATIAATLAYADQQDPSNLDEQPLWPTQIREILETPGPPRMNGSTAIASGNVPGFTSSPAAVRALASGQEGEQ